MLKTRGMQPVPSVVTGSALVEASDQLKHEIEDAAGLAGEFLVLGSYLRARDVFMAESPMAESINNAVFEDWVHRAAELVDSQTQVNQRITAATQNLIDVIAALESNLGRSAGSTSRPEAVASQPSRERSEEIAEMLEEVWPDIEASMIYLRDK